ncbi:MAG: hypothetical protein QNJ57_04765 [Flavobacteriaceae bacterium]|nr:hypothetical protein [Flavobacteriaceae bacterium]
MKKIITPLILLLSIMVVAQQKDNSELPYHQIPDYPENYTAGSVAARMIDGLGFRYYWATEGLREEDLDYKPSESGRACKETLDHIYGLSRVIVNAATKTVNDRTTAEKEQLSIEEMRKKTLLNFQKASQILREETDLSAFKLMFKSQYGTSDYPFWNNINGPIADAIWHAGQVVLMRRASGNPLNPKVSVFNGKLRE